MVWFVAVFNSEQETRLTLLFLGWQGHAAMLRGLYAKKVCLILTRFELISFSSYSIPLNEGDFLYNIIETACVIVYK